jgi:hypothetical protein
MASLPLSNSFEPFNRIFPYYVEIKKLSTIKYQYTVTRYSAVFDRIADEIIFDIKDKGIPKDITLQNINDKYYVYLECSFNMTNYTLTSSAFKGSPSLLPFIDGSDGPKGFDQTYARALIATIGYGGYVCQNKYSMLNTKLGILNAGLVVHLSDNTYSYDYAGDS